MTLIEALKTGRKIRNTKLNIMEAWNYPTNDSFSPKEILSDTWEVEPEKILLSVEDIEAAWSRVFRVPMCSSKADKDQANRLAKELGFK